MPIIEDTGVTGYHGCKSRQDAENIRAGIRRAGHQGHGSPEWQAFYLSPTPHGAAAYAYDQTHMATAGAVVEVRIERVSVMPVDKELVESTGEDQRDTEAINKIKSVLGIPGDEPLMDALGERGIVLRVDDTAGGGVDEYIVPWSIAETISHRVFVMNFDDDQNGARAAAEYSTNPSSNGRGHAHRGDYVGPVPDVVGTERVTMPETQIPAYDPVPDPPSARTEPGSSRIEL